MFLGSNRGNGPWWSGTSLVSQPGEFWLLSGASSCICSWRAWPKKGRMEWCPHNRLLPPPAEHRRVQTKPRPCLFLEFYGQLSPGNSEQNSAAAQCSGLTVHRSRSSPSSILICLFPILTTAPL